MCVFERAGLRLGVIDMAFAVARLLYSDMAQATEKDDSATSTQTLGRIAGSCASSVDRQPSA